MRSTVRTIAAVLALGVVLLAGPAPAQPLYPYPPVPPPRAEPLPPPPPGERWMFEPGHWHWDGREYVWITGRWVERPVPGLQWAPGHWAWRGGWIWIPPHWR